ncbi:SNF7 family protein [Heterostelium album PN500]|uniref:SNF7 family protein n=1 Tax=Heterostelium pallidum (strain ATCC 26659 / Pp 5 / PN500) TaxID=670386 RepID=D3BLD5_HETP5|nr:SNF7 family protein [Heterostelium album PN500]EFA77869.1 SNF7 family protein [Heterostelium album PN500]|eukprot:XP_020429997.1 SNF7 family protein [Heterostelium album PN500]
MNKNNNISPTKINSNNINNSSSKLDEEHESRKILLSRLPASRQQNPERYDNILNFWSKSIRRVIDECNLLIFTPQQLKEIFTVEGGITPISLMNIIDEIERGNDIELLSKFTTQMGWSSWLWNRVAVPTFQWSVSKVYPSSMNSPRKTDNSKAVLERKLVCPAAANIKAEELYQIQLDRIQSTIDNIVSLSNVEKEIADWLITKEELALLLHILDKEGKAKLIVHNNETKGVKFANEGEKVVVLDTDLGVLELNNTYEKLIAQEEKLKNDIDACSEQIRTYVRAKQRDLSLTQLKRKKTLESILAKRQQASNNIHELLASIESAHSNQQVMDTLCVGVSTLKKVNEKMSVDQVDKVMDDFADVMLNQKEIEEAITTGMAANAPESNPEEDAELERELEKLEEEQKLKQQQQNKTPTTENPTTTTTTTTSKTPPVKSQEDIELEKELEQLENLSLNESSPKEKKKEPILEAS